VNVKKKRSKKLLWIPAAILALALLLFAPKLADKLLPEGGESADTQQQEQQPQLPDAPSSGESQSPDSSGGEQQGSGGDVTPPADDTPAGGDSGSDAPAPLPPSGESDPPAPPSGGDPEPVPPADKDLAPLQVHFINVGQADCILLTCGGETMLVDGGDWEDENLIIGYLRLQGIEKLTYVVGTHGHADHIGSLHDVVKAFPTENVFFNDDYYDSYNYRELLYAAKGQGIGIQVPKVGDSWMLGDAKVTVLAPIKEYSENLNDNSLVLRVDHGERSLLLTGDMEWQEEQDLCQSGANLKADLLKVGHHGSYTSSSYVFLWNVMPQYAVISCGRNNEYGHPHEATMSRLNNAEVTVYRTDINGHVVATSDGKSWSFVTQY